MATSSSIPSTPDTHFGFHDGPIQSLQDEWDSMFEPDDSRLTAAQDLLQTVLHRKKPFYYSDSLFDIPTHPIKIFSYPTDHPVPSFSDALADILRLPPDDEVVDPMVKHFLNQAEEGLSQVLFPVTMPVFPTEDRIQHCGIARVDLNSLIPSPFRERDRIFQVGEEDWTTAVVPHPGVIMMNFDHVLCGQIKAHFFGKQLWFLCQGTNENMEVWFRGEFNVGSTPGDDAFAFERMKNMISECDDLLVFVSGAPSIMVFPPHCFQGSLTYSLSCHSTLRGASDYWMEEMWGPVVVLGYKRFMDAFREGPREKLEQYMDKIVPDLITWGEWVKKRERPPTATEEKMISMVARVARETQYTFKHSYGD